MYTSPPSSPPPPPGRLSPSPPSATPTSSLSLFPTPVSPPSPSSPLSALRSQRQLFSVAQFDVYRLFALLATAASSNSFPLLALLSAFIPLGLEAEAAEALLPVQVFAGIPKTIEGLTVVRAEVDRRQSLPPSSRLAAVRQSRLSGSAQLLRVLGEEEGGGLLERLSSYDDPRRPPPSPSLSLSPALPSLPAVPPPLPPLPTPTPPPSARRGVTSPCSPCTGSRLRSCSAPCITCHPSLQQSVLQHVYGAVLCTPVLPLQCVELISMACLMGERCGRQLFSHVRGGLVQGCTRQQCEAVLRDAACVYREAARREAEEGWRWVDDALQLVHRIDRKVNPPDTPTAPRTSAEAETVARLPPSAPPTMRRSTSQPHSAKL